MGDGDKGLLKDDKECDEEAEELCGKEWCEEALEEGADKESGEDEMLDWLFDNFEDGWWDDAIRFAKEALTACDNGVAWFVEDCDEAW